MCTFWVNPPNTRRPRSSLPSYPLPSSPSTPSPYPAPLTHLNDYLLPARHPRWYPLPVAGAVAPEGKARDGEGEEEDSPPPQRGAEPKKTIPKAEYTGPADGLFKAYKDVNKLNELIAAGIGIRGTVRRK